jgi:hypothetical protein
MFEFLYVFQRKKKNAMFFLLILIPVKKRAWTPVQLVVIVRSASAMHSSFTIHITYFLFSILAGCNLRRPIN